jgi:putative serine protease PepD
MVTDGSAWRQPGGADWQGAPSAHPSSAAQAPDSPWWSNALEDPWRDPDAPTAMVIRPPTAPPPLEPEPPPDPPGAATRRGLGLIFTVSLVTAVLAGALGGTLGYVFASRGGAGGHTVLGASGNGSQAALANRAPDSLAAAVAKVLPSVVTIKVGNATGYSLGSGFIVSSNGYVVTNDHVVEGLTGTATVTFNDSTNAQASLVGEDQESDVAVLKLSKTGLTPVVFGNSDQVAVGDPVLAAGSPLALQNTVTYGIVSAKDRTIEADEPGGPTRYYAAIQTDAAVNHGNSGGPLVDAAGRVIGINSVIKSMASDSQDAGNIGLAFAIPINQAKRIAEDIIDTGHAKRTVIGAELSSSYQNPNGGVEVTVVTPGGPAAAAGLKAGDVVTRINGDALEQPTDLIALVRMYPPGQAVSVQYQRDGSTQTVQVTLASDSK